MDDLDQGSTPNPGLKNVNVPFSLKEPKDMRSFHTWVLQLVYVYMLYIYNLIIMVDTDIK